MPTLLARHKRTRGAERSGAPAARRRMLLVVGITAVLALLARGATDPTREHGGALTVREAAGVVAKAAALSAPTGGPAVGAPPSSNAFSPTGAVTRLIDALNRSDATQAAALFASDAMLLQARTQIWVDQETGIASDPFGTGLWVPSREAPAGPDDTIAWAVGHDAVAQWLRALVAHHVALTTSDPRVADAPARAEWDFIVAFDTAPGLRVEPALHGHAVAELRDGSLAVLALTVDPYTLQQRSQAVAAAVAATMAAYPTTPADTGEPTAAGQGTARGAFGGPAPRDPEPQRAWLNSLLVGLAALALGISRRRGKR